MDITPENVWVILDSVESDHEDDLADVMKDSNTEFLIIWWIDLIIINLTLSYTNLIPLTTSMFKTNAHPRKRKTSKKKSIV